MHCIYLRTQNIKYWTQKYAIPDSRAVSAGEEHAMMEVQGGEEGGEGFQMVAGWFTDSR